MKKLIEYITLAILILMAILFSAAIGYYEYVKFAAYWRIAFGLILFSSA